LEEVGVRRREEWEGESSHTNQEMRLCFQLAWSRRRRNEVNGKPWPLTAVSGLSR